MKEQYYYPLKRLSDIFLSIIIGALSLPVCLITAVAIKIDSRGPVLADVPPRVGKNRRSFKIFKFRSMIPNAHQMIRQDPKLKKVFAELKKNNFKLKNDPRITRVGKFIRKYSIDELPQLINVIKGEMSLVGPRPYYADELAEYEKRFPQTKNLINEALTVKPGITGLWQVSGRSDVNFEERIALDARYARRKNLLDDIVILAKSPWVVLTGKGAS
ncbi:MAG: sugar transferase [Patescibacteria group bacterium]|jgi:lipopolysaccharide/colanic/teichoic acid biosynthesis glycosyltransferase